MNARSGPVAVLVGWDLEPHLIDRIAGLDPRVRLLNREAEPLKPPAELWPPFPDELMPMLAETEVLFTLRAPRDLMDLTPGLRWVQSQAAGVDALLSQRLLESDVVITTASGIHVIPFSEAVLGGIIALAKSYPQALRDQIGHRWRRYIPDELHGATVGIIGAGNIGTGIAEKCRAMGMQCLGIRRSMHEPQRNVGPFELLLPPWGLDRLLAESDYVVISAPSTPETKGMMGRSQFATMRPGARFINVARGDLVDEDALIDALGSGHLAGAYLDVFAQEPLPPDSPLWDMPNVLITPHASAGSPHRMERVVDVFLDNLRRYLDNRPLRNMFQRDRGY